MEQIFSKANFDKTMEILNLEGNSGCLSASYQTGNKKLVFVCEKRPCVCHNMDDTENIYESLTIS